MAGGSIEKTDGIIIGRNIEEAGGIIQLADRSMKKELNISV